MRQIRQNERIYESENYYILDDTKYSNCRGVAHDANNKIQVKSLMSRYVYSNGLSVRNIGRC